MKARRGLVIPDVRANFKAVWCTDTGPQQLDDVATQFGHQLHQVCGDLNITETQKNAYELGAKWGGCT